MSSRKPDGTFEIAREKPEPCSQCGEFLETRPYGPGGARVCFNCAMKDEAGTEERFRAVIDGEEPK